METLGILLIFLLLSPIANLYICCLVVYLLYRKFCFLQALKSILPYVALQPKNKLKKNLQNCVKILYFCTFLRHEIITKTWRNSETLISQNVTYLLVFMIRKWRQNFTTRKNVVPRNVNYINDVAKKNFL